MQRFLAADAKYHYSPEHAAIGTVEPGERFEVESVEGFGNAFQTPEDWTPESYAAATKLKWAVVGPIDVAGARAGGAVAVTIESVEVTTPGVVVFGPYTNEDAYKWWEEEDSCLIYDCSDGVVRFDERTTLPARPVIGCLAARPAAESPHASLQGRYGGNMDCKDLVAGTTLVLPVEHDGAGLYFGDCKPLLTDGEIIGPPEVGALITATAEPRERPASMTWPRLETPDSLMTLVSGKPLEVAARQAYRELLEWLVEDHEIERRQAALLMGMVAHAGICQCSNDYFTASAVTPRGPWLPYKR